MSNQDCVCLVVFGLSGTKKTCIYKTESKNVVVPRFSKTKVLVESMEFKDTDLGQM